MPQGTWRTMSYTRLKNPSVFRSAMPSSLSIDTAIVVKKGAPHVPGRLSKEVLREGREGATFVSKVFNSPVPSLS